MPIGTEEKYLHAVNLLGNRIRLYLPFTKMLHLPLDVALLYLHCKVKTTTTTITKPTSLCEDLDILKL